MLREVRLYGALAQRFGRVHHLAVTTAQEAVRALSANFPGFEAYLRTNSEPGYHVWVGRRNIGEAQLADPAGGDEVIRIAPALAGAKKGGLIQTIIGAALVVAGLFLSPVGGTWLVQIGAALALGGVAQMLTPTPKMQTSQAAENKQSYVFSGAVNVAAQGAAVPVMYGEMIVGSAVLSAGMSTSSI